ncbi:MULTISPECIES: alpha/beta hydrolase [unclassified Halomonas]|uniref:RBBP9/YdeN family alpha/beta hydrolase n=1 Tax=unclassified Halomonas TaxID=2609666 RepID=UPI00209D0486|nr:MULTISPECIES: alpha/beta hydrolase [unclassified Halomonas]MCP1313881.1 alpha/beta hydrolase [Halomonas sp. 707D7]MCP1326529.1 alpha/beta hydrolase [Halomonas sp. 707D4]
MIDDHYLIVPGWHGSDADHWQSHWQSRLINSSRTRVESWSHPERNDWIEALNRAVSGASAPVVLVAHSLGCITVAHWAGRHPNLTHRIKGALLVAPADVERGSVSQHLVDFAPIPLAPLPFASLVVGSTNDPAASLERIQHFANAWSSALHVIQGAGHINTQSGHHQWPEGMRLLGCFTPCEHRIA